MSKGILQQLVKEILTEASAGEVKKLRRAVILSIFTSNIPNEIKRDLSDAISSAPDAEVRKVSKVFLDQVIKDEETLLGNSDYEELKQDPEFQRLADIVNQKIKSDNKAGLLDLSNIAFTTSDISKPFSYSTLLYYAVENEAQQLLNYLVKKYKDNFSKVLYKMLPSPGGPAIKPTREGLNELEQADLQGMLSPNYLPSADFDKKNGTKLAKTYKFPMNPEIVRNHINQAVRNQSLFNDESYSQDTNNFYNALIKDNGDIRVRVQNTEDKWNVIYKMLLHLNPSDIKYFIENPNSRSKDEMEKILPVEKAYEKHNIAINWIPSPKSWDIIKNALINKYPDIQWPLEDLMEEAKNFFKLIM